MQRRIGTIFIYLQNMTIIKYLANLPLVTHMTKDIDKYNKIS